MSKGFYAGLSFEEAVRRFADTVYGVCVMRLQNAADAEDCFQNTFVKLYEKSPDFRGVEHLKAWLIRVAINECMSLLRKNRRHISLQSLSDVPFEKSEDESDISWALLRLEPKYREVLYLHYCEQYKVEEIAQILGKNPNTVKTLLKRGRERLRSVYGGERL